MTQQPAQDRGRRFLSAFVEVEKALQHLARLQGSRPFAEMLEGAKRHSAAVRHYEIDLKELADLRNAIVHRRRADEPIAEPHEDTVRELEGIGSILADPPKLLSVISARGVLTLTPAETIGAAARVMAKEDYSQIPIYSGTVWAGLLSTEGVTRWLGHHLPEAEIIEDEPISSALALEAGGTNCRFVARSATVFDGLSAFAETSREGVRLDAILITETGRKDQQPLGIATVFDLPRMHAAAGRRG